MKRRLIASFCFSLVAAIAVLAAPPPLTITPTTPNVGDVVTVSGKEALSFDLRGAPYITHHNGKSVVFVMPENGGVTILAGKAPLTELKEITTIQLGAGSVNPGPGPDPIIDNKPTSLFIVVVEETAVAAAQRGQLFANEALAARVTEKKHKWRVVDKDVVGEDGKPPADIQRFLEAASGKKLPQLYLVDSNGKTRYKGDLPATAKAVLDLVIAYGG